MFDNQRYDTHYGEIIDLPTEPTKEIYVTTNLHLAVYLMAKGVPFNSIGIAYERADTNTTVKNFAFVHVPKVDELVKAWQMKGSEEYDPEIAFAARVIKSMSFLKSKLAEEGKRK